MAAARSQGRVRDRPSLEPRPKTRSALQKLVHRGLFGKPRGFGREVARIRANKGLRGAARPLGLLLCF